MRDATATPRTYRLLRNLCVCLCAALALSLLLLLVHRVALETEGEASAPVRQLLHLGLNLTNYPPGIINQFDEERDFLKFHRCANEGEAFSGSWLVTQEHFRSRNISYDLSQANAELAFFLLMETRRSKKAWHPIGSIMQTLDVLDLSVIHLSAYERLYRKHEFSVEEEDVVRNSTLVMLNAARELKVAAQGQLIRQLVDGGSSSSIGRSSSIGKLGSGGSDKSATSGSDEAQAALLDTTLAMLPWLGGSVGSGHSALTYRATYLEACFWSIYRFIPNIVIGVMSEKDRKAVRRLGMPVKQIVLLKIPDPKALPAALVQRVHRDFMKGKHSYRYYFYCESDQVLVVKPSSLSDSLAFLEAFPRRVLVPHRLIPYPAVALERLNRSSLSLSAASRQSADSVWSEVRKPGIDGASCCLPRQNCAHRTDWVAPSSTTLPIVDLFGIPVALGNAHFDKQIFRACVMGGELKTYGTGQERVCP